MIKHHYYLNYKRALKKSIWGYSNNEYKSHEYRHRNHKSPTNRHRSANKHDGMYHSLKTHGNFDHSARAPINRDKRHDEFVYKKNDFPPTSNEKTTPVPASTLAHMQ